MLEILGRFFQGPPAPVIAVLVALQLLALLLPVLMSLVFFAGIVAAFLVLTCPLARAAKTLLAAGLLYAFCGYLMTQSSYTWVVPVIFLGSPAMLAWVLRKSGSLSLALLIGFLVGWLAATALSLLPTDPTGLWAEGLTAAEAEQLDTLIGVAGIQAVTAQLLVASTVFLFSLLLLVGRYWESRLSERPFFRQEFQMVHFGRIIDLAFLTILMATWFRPEPFLLGLSFTLIGAFLFPALATAHRLSGHLSAPVLALVPFYLLMAIMKEFVLMVTVVGAADDLLGLSRRYRSVAH